MSIPSIDEIAFGALIASVVVVASVMLIAVGMIAITASLDE
ncbi:hypothetical protein ACWIGM_05170 [Bosea sp. NPDC055332]